MTEESDPPANEGTAHRKNVLVLGATGTIGRAVVAELISRGHSVTCFVRPAGENGVRVENLSGAELRYGDVQDKAALRAVGFKDAQYDAVLSCLASRTGAPDDAWAIDYQANLSALEIAVAAGVPHFVLLSAICVQMPLLTFQKAKLAFEEKLIQSGLIYSIVRPTAFFKSLSGQIDRLRQGKPFLLFGDGSLTACKPISDGDLAKYLVDCLNQARLQNQVLPIGGPGPAITPRDQGERLFELLGKEPRYRKVPVAMMDAIIGFLSVLGNISPAMMDKAELARIGRYYATESMLVWDADKERYDADATPSAGTETLFDFYEDLVAGRVTVDRGDHAVF
ncbi:MAG: NAD(P)H-binding protein [Pseudomonadota bacterium]